MKPVNAPRPDTRFTCQVVRFWSSVRNDDAPPARHLERCESCRCFFSSVDQLQLHLRHSARPLSTPPSGLENRILHALDRSEALAIRKPQHRLFTTSVALCVVVFSVAALWRLNLVPFLGPNANTAGEYATEVAALIAAVRAMPSDLRVKIEEPTAQLVQKNSLGREVENVYSDAKSALDFLSANFLPASAPEASSNSGHSDSIRQT